MERKAQIYRKTQETEINVELNLDGEGKSEIQTGIPFFDHMLVLFARHSLIDLRLTVRGDLEVDCHHSMEDTGLVLGQAIKEALGDKRGIYRYGFFLLPMDETLVQVALDLSGRPCLVWRGQFPASVVNTIDVRLFREFFQALTNKMEATIHIELIRSEEIHHALEAIFKGVGRSLQMAISFNCREKGIPSSKGTL